MSTPTWDATAAHILKRIEALAYRVAVLELNAGKDTDPKAPPTWCAPDCPWPWTWRAGGYRRNQQEGRSMVLTLRVAEDVRFCDRCGREKPG